jgi:Protein of unknown function (DUF2939)
MKALFALLVAVAVVVGALFLLAPRIALTRAVDALEAKDPARVEEHVDLQRVSTSAVKAMAAFSKGAVGLPQAGAGGAGFLSGLLDALVDGAVAVTGGALGMLSAEGLRMAIKDGTWSRTTGPFAMRPGKEAIGAIETRGNRGTVVVLGTCGTTPASFRLELEQVGSMWGFIPRWQVVGVDASSMQALVAACRLQG